MQLRLEIAQPSSSEPLGCCQRDLPSGNLTIEAGECTQLSVVPLDVGALRGELTILRRGHFRPRHLLFALLLLWHVAGDALFPEEMDLGQPTIVTVSACDVLALLAHRLPNLR